MDEIIEVTGEQLADIQDTGLLLPFGFKKPLKEGSPLAGKKYHTLTYLGTPFTVKEEHPFYGDLMAGEVEWVKLKITEKGVDYVSYLNSRQRDGLRAKEIKTATHERKMAYLATPIVASVEDSTAFMRELVGKS